MRTGCTLCLPAPICMHLPLLGENFPQPDIGAVCPFFGKEAEILRNTGRFSMESPESSEKADNMTIFWLQTKHWLFIQSFPRHHATSRRSEPLTNRSIQALHFLPRGRGAVLFAVPSIALARASPALECCLSRAAVGYEIICNFLLSGAWLLIVSL